MEIENSFSFTAPIIEYNVNLFSDEIFKKAIYLFNSGKYNESIKETLKAINSESIKDFKKDSFLIPHGSITLNIEIKEDKYTISSKFLKLPSSGVIALLRKTAEINFESLTLSQLVLKDGNLFFEFKAPLHLCHPKKVLSVICETCFNADYYDDIFYSQFKAERTYTPQIEEIPQKTKDTAWNIFQETLKECGQYIEYFEQKRLNYLALDSICIALTKIDYVFSPQGLLGAKIEKSISDAYKHNSLEDALRISKDNIKYLTEFTKENFFASLYKIKIFAAIKPAADFMTVQNSIGQRYASAKQEFSEGKHESATCLLFLAIYDLFYKYTCSSKIKKIALKGLKDASQKKWRDAGIKLINTLSSIMEIKE